MKVVRRTQITRVKTERTVYHTVELNGETYERVKTVKIDLPYMDCDIEISEPKIVWRQFVSRNTISTLSKKTVDRLELEEIFLKLNLNEINGNA